MIRWAEEEKKNNINFKVNAIKWIDMRCCSTAYISCFWMVADGDGAIHAQKSQDDEMFIHISSYNFCNRNNSR